MIRKRIGSMVVRAYPRVTRRARGAEMVDTLLDASENSSRAFVLGCVSLLSGGFRERGHRWARLALAGVAVIACGAGVAVALTNGGSPSATLNGVSRAPSAWLRANRQALALVFNRGPACRISVTPRAASTQVLEGAPTTGLSSQFAVLRRPAPATASVSAARLRRLHLDAQGIYIHYARQGVTDGITYYMVPAASVGGNPLPDRCYAEQLTAFEGQAARLPAAQRPRAIAWERQLIKQRRGPTPGIAVITVGGGSISGQYLTLDELRTDPWRAGGGGSNHITKTALVLPDSVASVTAHYAAQSYPGRVPRPVTITRRVTDNLAIFVFRGAWDPPALTYSSATGAVLWSTPTTNG
jgi:hypothetical protein